MTAEPLASAPSDEELPEWFYPPEGGWTADDLDRLPPSAPRFELIDGALVMMSPQTYFHSRVMWRLAQVLHQAAPEGMEVTVEMSVRLGPRQRPEPDVLVVNGPPDLSATSLPPEDVVLAVEIVSDESRERDRKTKPLKYAEAGIRHFWRIEREHDKPVIHTYELDDTTGAYVATGIHRDKAVMPVPFPVEIDLHSLAGR
ncbi:Uma2 family endonuclease [Streptomyces alkaliterrae]|uniref:Uma2 family endonuclease n=1 Tax=Streptomyces alkaliterrae TaxID=2213162 RepID=A0A5P0YQ06_9ACTN|nr:Uma2 family endonuclease [Streptomyces alkaliterrae]MBB1254149.1 Uma2 family endonuclease [Streptomyces alkaliterrae]MBB1260041.1 Uma2 family endonuclease [Streptomyces alkaliterrae]MQS01512.1 Uma2 family endonuclease [Streptomyces alkaliterrae]